MLYNQRFSCETSPGRNPGKKHLLHCVHKRGCSFLVPFGRGCHTHRACSCAQHSDSAVTGLTSLLSTEQQLHRNTEKSTRTFFLFLTSSQCSYKQVILLQQQLQYVSYSKPAIIHKVCFLHMLTMEMMELPFYNCQQHTLNKSRGLQTSIKCIIDKVFSLLPLNGIKLSSAINFSIVAVLRAEGLCCSTG